MACRLDGMTHDSNPMMKKRLIASTVAALLSAVQVAAWAFALEHMEHAAGASAAWPSLDRALSVLSEPALMALCGCASIVLGVAVGMVGRKPQDDPDAARLQVSGRAASR